MTEVIDRIQMARPRRFRRYPAYKDSGVEWLGEIPAHWKVERLKYLATLNDEALAESTDPNFGMAYVDIGSVDAAAGITETEAIVFEKAPSRARRLVRNGDVIVSTVRTYLRAIAAIEAPEPNVIVSTGFAVIRPRQLQSSFASYALRAPHFVERVVANSVGVSYPAINAGNLACFPIAYTSVDEQRAIATVLDRETARIDGLVERKERLIELLQEKRTALITRAVTRGLDPNVPMKDSGVEWLGGIPAHWEVKKLGYVTNIGNGSTPNRNEERYWVDGSHPWLTSAKINEGVIATADQFVTDVAFRECHLPSVTAGSVLVAITGEGQTRGRAALLSIDSTISQHLAYITPSCREINAGFLVRLFEARYEWLREESSGSGSTRAALTCEFLRSARLAFPPRGEQRAITAFLDRDTAKIDALIAKVRQAMDHLKEFRTAFISAAVTGKIDVREDAS